MTSTDDSSPSGPAWAAILAAAIGCACFGILTDLTEALKGVSRALNFYSPSGDLSGKSTLAVVFWLAAWAVLRFRWRERNIERPGRVAIAACLLVLVSLLATFPPFFGMFSTE